MIICDEDTLARFRTPGPCELCGKLCRVREPHHIIPRGMGGGRQLDVPHNLLSLGSSLAFQCDCHTRIHNGEYEQWELFQKAADREGVSDREEMEEALWLLVRLSKPTTWELERAIGQVRMGVGYLALRMLLGAGKLEVAA